MSSVNDLINQINQLSGFSIPSSSVVYTSGALTPSTSSQFPNATVYIPATAPYGTIPTTGIYPGGVIKSEQILRIINALNGVSVDTIIISGSFLTSGSNILDGNLAIPFLNNGDYLYISEGLVTGSSTVVSSSYAISSSYSDFATTASFASNFNPDATASYALRALTASYALNASSPFSISTGSVIAQVNVDPRSIFLIRTGSNTIFNVDSTGNIITNGSITIENTGSLSSFLLIKNDGTEYVKINNEGVLTLHQYDTPPAAVSGGMYFDNVGNFYVGL